MSQNAPIVSKDVQVCIGTVASFGMIAVVRPVLCTEAMQAIQKWHAALGGGSLTFLASTN